VGNGSKHHFPHMLREHFQRSDHARKNRWNKTRSSQSHYQSEGQYGKVYWMTSAGQRPISPLVQMVKNSPDAAPRKLGGGREHQPQGKRQTSQPFRQMGCDMVPYWIQRFAAGGKSPYHLFLKLVNHPDDSGLPNDENRE